MYDRSVSSFRYLMLIKHAVDFLYLCPPMKCEVNWALNSLKVLIEFGVNLLNQILAAPLSVVRKALHLISICSFIAYISARMGSGVVSMR